MTDASTRDGGRTALAGYVYQFLGVLGTQALAQDARPDATLLGRLAELIPLVQDLSNRLYSEYFDEDAVVELPQENAPSEWVLIQYKFSRSPSDSPLEPAEFKRILNKMRDRARRIGCFDSDQTRYLIVTNRSYSLQTRNILANIEASNLTSDQKRVASKLPRSEVGSPSIGSWKDALKEYAVRLGCSDPEIAAGIHTLLGSLVDRAATASDPLVRIEDLHLAFANDRGAQQLTPEAQATSSCRQLDAIKSVLRVPPSPVRRSVLDDITRAIRARGTCVIILRGHGGSGKTVVLWQWGREIANSYPHSGLGPLVAVIPTDEFGPYLPARVISDAAHLSASHPRRYEGNNEACLRLRRANPTMPNPMMSLGLDDVASDTLHPQQISELRSLLHWSWAEASASPNDSLTTPVALLATCRPGSEETVIASWPGRAEHPSDSHRRLEIIDVGDFSPLDLALAADSCDAAVAARIKQTVSSATAGGDASSSVTATVRFENKPHVPSVHPDILNALCHPAMWHAFTLVRETHVQHRILDGDPDALNDMCSFFVDWFNDKATSSTHANPFNSNDLRHVLPQIAHATHGQNPTRYPSALWREHAAAQIGPAQANRLYNEAQSAGLISVEGQNWRWRHIFVEDYLASLYQPDRE